MASDRKEMLSQIARNIRGLRQRQRMTQAQLANMLHVTPQAVSKWERGAAVPDIQMVLLIAMEFGVSTDDLLSKDLA